MWTSHVSKIQNERYPKSWSGPIKSQSMGHDPLDPNLCSGLPETRPNRIDLNQTTPPITAYLQSGMGLDLAQSHLNPPLSGRDSALICGQWAGHGLLHNSYLLYRVDSGPGTKACWALCWAQLLFVIATTSSHISLGLGSKRSTRLQTC